MPFLTLVATISDPLDITILLLSSIKSLDLEIVWGNIDY